MDDEELSSYIVAVDELGQQGLWAAIKDVFEARAPLRNVSLSNKLGRVVTLQTLPVQYLKAQDRKITKYSNLGNSAILWWRHPYAYILLICTVDMNEYRAHLKPNAKRVIQELERSGQAPGGTPEWLVVYVRPPNADPQDKGVKRVFDKIVDDFQSMGSSSSTGGSAMGLRRWLPPAQRVVRLDWPYRGGVAVPPTLPFLATPAPSPAMSFFSDLARPFASAAMPSGAAMPGPQQQGVAHQRAVAMGGSAGQLTTGAVTSLDAVGSVAGMDDVENVLKECIRCSFESRQAAYVDAIQGLLANRFEKNWMFTQLFLAKDCYTQQLETAGMWEDALQEAVELEAAFLEALPRGAVPNLDFGGAEEGDDSAALLSNLRKASRRAVTQRNVFVELSFRQFLFSVQARVMLRQGRPIDMAQRALSFIKTMGDRISEVQQQQAEAKHPLRPMLKEAWTFSACITVALALTSAARASAFQPVTSVGPHHAVGNGSFSTAAASNLGGPMSTDASSEASMDTTIVQQETEGVAAPGGLQATQMSEPLRTAQNFAVQLLLGSQSDGSKTGLKSMAPEASPDWDWNLGTPLTEVVLQLLGLSEAVGVECQDDREEWSRLLATYRAAPELQQQQVAFRDYYNVLGHLYLTARAQLIRLACAAYASPTKEQQMEQPSSSGSAGMSEKAPGPLAGLQVSELEYYSRLMPDFLQVQEEAVRFEAVLTEGQATQAQILAAAFVAESSTGRGLPSQAGPELDTFMSEGVPLGMQSKRTGSYPDNLQQAAMATGHNRSPSQQLPMAGSGHFPGSSSQHQLPGVTSAPVPMLAQQQQQQVLQGSGTMASRTSFRGPVGPTTLPPVHRPSSSGALLDAATKGPSGTAAVSTASTQLPLAGMASGRVEVLPPPARPCGPSARAHHENFFQKLDGVISQVGDAQDALHGGSGAGRALEQAGPSDISITSTDLPPAAVSLDGGLSWISEWRLRSAFSSKDACEALVLQLGLLAAGCFQRGGRSRSAGLVVEDTTLLLLRHHRWDAAIALLYARCADLEREGWYTIQGELLLQLLRVQRLLSDMRLPYTCMVYLNIPQEAVRPEHRQQVQQLLVGCCAQHSSSVPRSLPAFSVLKAALPPQHTSWLVGSPQDVLNALDSNQDRSDLLQRVLNPPPVPFLTHTPVPPPPSPQPPPRRSLNRSLTWAPRAQHHPDLDALHAAPGSSGGACMDNHASQRGAQMLCIGQMCYIEVEVVSTLPGPIWLSGAELVLGVLQPGLAPAFSRAASHRLGQTARQLSMAEGPGRLTTSGHHMTHNSLDNAAALQATARGSDTAQARQQHHRTGSAGTNSTVVNKQDVAFPDSMSSDGAMASYQPPAVQRQQSDPMRQGSTVPVPYSAASASLQRASNSAVMAAARSGNFSKGPGTASGPADRSAQVGAADLVSSPRHTPGGVTWGPDVMSPRGTASAAGLPWDADIACAVRWNSTPDLKCTTLVQVASAHAASSGGSRHARLSSGDRAAADALQGSTGGALTPPGDASHSMLQPGSSRLVFHVAPSHSGLYYLKQLSLSIGSCQVACSLQAAPPWQQAAAAAQRSTTSPVNKALRAWQASHATWAVGPNTDPHDETCDANADHAAVRPICLVVLPPQPRLHVECIAPGGSLVAGAPQQWVGVCIRPLSGSAPPLQHVRLHISTPSQQGVRICDHTTIAGLAGLPRAVAGLPETDVGHHVGSGAILSMQSSLGIVDDPLPASARGLFGASGGLTPSLSVRPGLEASVLAGLGDSHGLHALAGAAGLLGDAGRGAPTCRAQLMVITAADSSNMPSAKQIRSTSTATRPDSAKDAGQSERPAGLMRMNSIAHGRAGAMHDHSGSAAAAAYVQCHVLKGLIHVTRALRLNAVQQPILLWLPVYCPQQHTSNPQVVQILPAAEAPNKAGLHCKPTESIDRDLPAETGAEQLEEHLDLTVEYSGSDGCWRTQESNLTLCVRPALQIDAQAFHVSMGDANSVLLTLRLRSNAEQPVVLQELDLGLQAGFEARTVLWEPCIQLPYVLLPQTSLSLAWQLVELTGKRGVQHGIGDIYDSIEEEPGLGHGAGGGGLAGIDEAGPLRIDSPEDPQQSVFDAIGHEMVSEIGAGWDKSPRTSGPVGAEHCHLLLVYSTLCSAPPAHPCQPMCPWPSRDECDMPVQRVASQPGGVMQGIAGITRPESPQRGCGGSLSVEAVPQLQYPLPPWSMEAPDNTDYHHHHPAEQSPAMASATHRVSALDTLHASASSAPVCMYKWAFLLQHPPDPAAAMIQAKSQVAAQLLSPCGMCKLGQPMSFLWRVIRVTSLVGPSPGPAPTPPPSTSPTPMAPFRTSVVSSRFTGDADVFPTSPPADGKLAGNSSGAAREAAASSAAAVAQSEHLTYQIAVDRKDGLSGPHWRVLSRGHGHVRLAAQQGSAATIEVQVMPLVQGAAAPPRLVLQGAGIQQVAGGTDGSKLLLTVVP